ncbi:DNA cytosine methyltransferase [Mesorhizobium sp. M0633]|uniref:DNA cytosine methyltransferase n=1 Tax=Mesorhizobium sp. M0633 TaxID=2956977 RepID=UPI0033366876
MPTQGCRESEGCGAPRNPRRLCGVVTAPNAGELSAAPGRCGACCGRGFLHAAIPRWARGQALDEPAPAVVRTTRERPRQSHLEHPHPADAVHPSAAAILTQGQVSRLQGFPASWDWSAAAVRDVDQMIANAVPAPLAEAIGRIILTREAGDSIPEIQGRFGELLRRSRGFSKAAVRNCRSRVNRARRLLGGRTFADAAAELAALDAVDAFAALATGTRSDLRTALRLYREWQAEPPKAKRKPKVDASNLERWLRRRRLMGLFPAAPCRAWLPRDTEQGKGPCAMRKPTAPLTYGTAGRR